MPVCNCQESKIDGQSITTPGSVTSGAVPEVRQSSLGPEVKGKFHVGIDYMIYVFFVVISLPS